MTEIGLGDWRFEPAADDASARNRVVWTFKLNPYAGGEVRRVGLPQLAERTFGIHRPITIEAWLYLNGEYQTLVEGQAIIQGARSAQESLGEACDGRGEVAIFRTTAYRSIDTGQHQTLVAALT
jgi:hypothetical protein